ncbi:aspartate aminotransferase family protein [Virgibacillus ihumii]|uniref:aspartate aminotransferase family protein n=1 Tax=Virgibacillus ihumii TaxID=2686091 RepID=UPI00157CB02C|nr:aspartate aminotransferase family protein [Virgibacillus ihumii]
MEKIKSSLMNTYNRFPITVDKAKGSYVWDADGKEYLDFAAGIATCNLGHVPDEVKKSITSQLDHVWHCSNLYQIGPQQQLADLLTEYSCLDQVFFCNSGAEANEAAIKLVRAYNQDNKTIAAFQQSFHGRTMAALSATGQEKLHVGFEPLVQGFTFLTYNDFDSLRWLRENPPAAVMLELVQGEGGVIPADHNWVNALVRICNDEKILIVIDEVQTGMGRTGTLFAYEEYGFEPDIITLAKGLGSGFPIGAMLAKEEVANAFQPGSHASTFGGNPLASAAGVSTLSEIVNSNILDNCMEMSEKLFTGLKKLQEEFPQIKSIRGKGLLVGIVVDGPAIDLVTTGINRNLLITMAGPNVVRLLPALNITENDLLLFFERFRAVLESVSKEVSISE